MYRYTYIYICSMIEWTSLCNVYINKYPWLDEIPYIYIFFIRHYHDEWSILYSVGPSLLRNWDHNLEFLYVNRHGYRFCFHLVSISITCKNCAYTVWHNKHFLWDSGREQCSNHVFQPPQGIVYKERMLQYYHLRRCMYIHTHHTCNVTLCICNSL